MTRAPGVEYATIRELRGPLMVVDNVSGVAYDELVEIETGRGERRLGRVIEVGEGRAVVQVFEGTQGLSISETRARFLGKTMELGVSTEMLGRVFDGLGRPIDGLPEPVAEEYRDINGDPINPNERDYPSDFIQTGVSAIDGMNSLVRGQKLPIFSGAGLPHNILAAQIARQATVPGKEEEFAVIFAAVGVQNDEARFFRRSLEESGAISRSTLFLNLADDPAIERVVTPRVALTLAEYLAFEHDYHVLVIITDMTNYCFSGRSEIITENGDILSIRDYITSQLTDGGKRYGRILSWHNWKAKPSPIALAEIVEPKEKKMIHIKMRSGAELTVTPDHKLLIDTETGPKMVEASKIKTGDFIYSLKKLDINNTWRPSLLELFWISGDENIYIQFKHSSIEKLLKNRFGSMRKASEVLNIDYRGVPDSLKKRCYGIGEVARISTRLNISLKKLSEWVEKVSCGGHASLRVKWSEVGGELLRLAGVIASDGAVCFYPEKNIYYVALYSSDGELIRRYRRLIRRLFSGIKLEEWASTNGVRHLRINSKPVALLFKALGLPGDLKPLVKLPEALIREFLAGYFDGDGHIRRNRAVFTTSSKLRAKRIQLLLKRLGIPSTIMERRTGFKASVIYDVVVSGRYVKELFKDVKLYHSGKRRTLQDLSGSRFGETAFDGVPRVFARILKGVREKYGLKQEDIGPSSTISNIERNLRGITRGKALKIVAKLKRLLGRIEEVEKLETLIRGNYILDRVIKVDAVTVSDDYVYDLTVPVTHTLIVENGIVSSNCEALREISAAREEVPGRKGYPGYMYTDLATIYERAGRIKGRKGSLTQMPILSMPSDDITHPIPDLTGYITEGQLVLSRDLYRKGIYPPLNVLMSLSRLMGPGIIAEKRTRADHGDVSDQLYASYARAVQLRALSEIVGKSGLSEIDLKYLEFGDLFEQRFLRQGYDENRTLNQTLEIAWDILSTLPETELTKIKEENLRKHYRKQRA